MTDEKRRKLEGIPIKDRIKMAKDAGMDYGRPPTDEEMRRLQASMHGFAEQKQRHEMFKMDEIFFSFPTISGRMDTPPILEDMKKEGVPVQIEEITISRDGDPVFTLRID